VESLLEQTSAQLRTELLPVLTEEFGVRIYKPEDLSSSAFEWLRRFFEMRVYPLLTPLAVDPGHPFPFVSSFSLNFIVVLRSEVSGRAWNALSYARIKVPRLLPRFISLPADETESGDRLLRSYILSEEVVRFFLPQLFPGLTVEGAFLFRVVRGAQPNAEPGESIQRRLRQRELNWPVMRLDVERNMPTILLDWLTDHLDAPPYVRFRLPDPLGDLQLVDLANLLDGGDSAARSDLLGDFPSV
jgi:polyphosphate kinase